jgi:predicted secreted acid phosphatase
MKTLYRLLFILSLCLSFSSVPAQGLLNLSKAKSDVARYYASGRYDHDVDSVMAYALTQLRAVKAGPRDVVVFDVDETAIANLPHIISMDFGFRLDIWNEWVNSAQAKAIPQVKRFYDTLITRGIGVVFLTGRMDEITPATRKNLLAEGYRKYDTLITRSKGDGYGSTGAFKTATRKKLEDAGYHIIMCIGDQDTDLIGGNAGIKIKLPNYIYLID